MTSLEEAKSEFKKAYDDGDMYMMARLIRQYEDIDGFEEFVDSLDKKKSIGDLLSYVLVYLA